MLRSCVPTLDPLTVIIRQYVPALDPLIVIIRQSVPALDPLIVIIRQYVPTLDQLPALILDFNIKYVFQLNKPFFSFKRYFIEILGRGGLLGTILIN